MRVAVGEQAALQHLVGRGPDAGHEVGRVEGRLLDVGEVVLGVAVEHQPADLVQRVVAVRPDLGHVEGVEVVALRLGGRHDLHLERPGGELAAVDRLVQVHLVRVGVLAGQRRGLLRGQALDALVGLEVVLDEELLAGAR